MRLSEHHKQLVNGKGQCSLPMYYGYGNECFCDEPAFGYSLPRGKEYWNRRTNEWIRWDGKYNGYVPALACVAHGGPTFIEVAHQENPCKYCGITVGDPDVEPGPCVARVEELRR